MVAPSDRLGSVWGIFFLHTPRGGREGENWKQTPPAPHPPAAPPPGPAARKSTRVRRFHSIWLKANHFQVFSHEGLKLCQVFRIVINRADKQTRARDAPVESAAEHSAILQSIRPGSGGPRSMCVCRRRWFCEPERCNWWTHWRVQGNLARASEYSERAG